MRFCNILHPFHFKYRYSVEYILKNEYILEYIYQKRRIFQGRRLGGKINRSDSDCLMTMSRERILSNHRQFPSEQKIKGESGHGHHTYETFAGREFFITSQILINLPHINMSKYNESQDITMTIFKIMTMFQVLPGPRMRMKNEVLRHWK